MAVPGEAPRARLRGLMNEAALGIRPWLEVTRALETAFDVDMVSLEIADRTSGDVRIFVEAIGDRAQREYEEHVFHINPRVHVPDPQLFTVYADRDAESSPFAAEYYDWSDQHRLPRYAAGGSVLDDRNHFAVLAMLTFADRGPPDEPSETAWAAMLPLVGNALEIERALAPHGPPGLAPLNLADCASDRAYALLDGKGRVIQASAPFHTQVDRSAALRLRGGRLVGARTDDHARIELLIGRAVTGAATRSAVRIAPAGGFGQGVVLRAISLGSSSDHFARLRPAALLVMIDLDAAATAMANDLRELWGLSPREAELALHLGTGLSLAQAAARLGIAEGTARQHLKRIFQRMDIDRQSDLVRLLARIA